MSCTRNINCWLIVTACLRKSSQLVAVGPPGPKKALKPEDPKRTNAGKAARICVDWAIKEYGDDGKGKGR